ncbi:MAG TPA: hypothetical protein VGO31_03130 [Microbacteriaceae bacterium]|nr:hypothetical protein [Microbacteriaceae bacterium]
MVGPRSALALLLAIVIAVGAAYEVAVAARWIEVGKLTSEGAPHEDTFMVVSLAAAVAGAILIVASPVRAAAAILLAACTLMLARYYSFDPYYAPALRRMSDGGVVAPLWIYTVTGITIACAASLVLRPRAAAVPAAFAVLTCAATVFFAAAGH